MIKYISVFFAGLLSASAAHADLNPERAYMTETSQQNACNMSLDFSEEREITSWRTVLDGVMGGRSTGVRFAEDEHMTFKGVINTNGGGFSSIRKQMQPGTLAGADRLKLKLRQDGRDYKLSFRTSARWRGRIVNYQVAIPPTPQGEWATVEVSLENMRTYFHGEPVPAAGFDASDVWEMGIILADGVDGPFVLDIASIVCAEGQIA